MQVQIYFASLGKAPCKKIHVPIRTGKIGTPDVDSPFVQATTAIAQGKKNLSFVSIQLPKPRLAPFSPKPLFERIAVLFKKKAVSGILY